MKKLKGIARTIFILLILIGNVSCDQLSKKRVREQLNYREQLSYLSNHFIVTKVENTGAFLSLGHALPKALRFILFILVPAVVLIWGAIYIMVSRNLSPLNLTGICFIIGGGIGNVLDRILYGSVTDFLHIDFVLFRTGIFNMADVSILAGMTIVIIDTILSKKIQLIKR